MKVLVTGATGFIGSHLCKRLLTEGHRVIGLTYSKNTERIESFKNDSNFVLLPCDVRDRDSLCDIMKRQQPKVVFHLAAQVPYTTGGHLISVNVDGTLNTLVAAEANEVESFVYVSSMAVYSGPPEYVPLDEKHPTRPIDLYGLTKLAGEKSCESHSSKMRMVILRYAGVYGKYSEPDRAVAIFLRLALNNIPLTVNGDGTQTSDFTYIDDIVRGTLLAWDKGAGIYNIGSGHEARLIDLANAVVKLTNSSSKLIVANNKIERPFRFFLDITKARNELNYVPMSFEQGLIAYRDSLNGRR